MKNCHFSIQFLYSIKFVNKQKFPDLNSERFQVKFSPISQKYQFLLGRLLELRTMQNTSWNQKYICNRSKYDYGLSFILRNFIYLAKQYRLGFCSGKLKCAYSWRVQYKQDCPGIHERSPSSLSAYIFFCRMDKSVRGTLDLPNVCFSSLSRRGDWLIDVSVEQFFIRTCFEVVVPFES